MPPDRSRTANTQGRQNSCSECAKGKRKCGLEQPNCARCTKQHLTCIYPLQPHPRLVNSRIGTPDSQDGLESTEIPLNFEDLGTMDDLFNFNATALTPSAINLFDFDFSRPSLDSFPARADFYFDEDDQIALQKTLYLAAKPFSPTHIAPFVKSRIEYSIEQLKLAPKMMVEENCTPWAHPMLYENFMPRSLQGAHAACALYITRNDTNAEHVTRYITIHAGELVTSALPNEPVEILARAHALILYQIMFVFGRDICVYEQAEKMVTHLDEVGEALLTIAQRQTDTTGSLPLYPDTAARSAWRSFVFCESVRRTLLSVFQFAGVCNLLHGQLKSCLDTLALDNKVTLSIFGMPKALSISRSHGITRTTY